MRSRRLLTGGVFLAVIALGFTPATPVPGGTPTGSRLQACGNSASFADLNGDGFTDLVVGVPAEGIGSLSDAGAVNVIYGSAAGLTAAGNQFWHQDSPGVRGTAAVDDRFGRSLATGDFNGDGFSDLAAGVPYDQVGSVLNAGAVEVLYGSAAGLNAVGNQLWTQDNGGIRDAAEAGDNFGWRLAWGDFNGDGFTDLAVGVPREDVGTVVDAGAVSIIPGSPGGLTAAGDQFWTQESGGIQDAAEAGDNYGFILAAGDFNSDGFADLAVGVIFEDVGTIVDAGAVNVIYGSAAGLTAAGNQFWTQDTLSIQGTAENREKFGRRLAVGDFNGDGFTDLAIGIPYDRLGGVKVGGVNVLFGSAAGLTDVGNQFWNQDSPGIQDSAEADERFGWALAGGDFNNDGFTDLAVGVPFESVGAVGSAGAVNVLFGSPAGLTDVGNQFWTQDSGTILDSAEDGDGFGWRVAAGDYNGDCFADLSVAVFKEDVGTIVNAGAAHVLYGSAAGLTDVGNQLWTQDNPGIQDTAEPHDAFGRMLPER